MSKFGVPSFGRDPLAYMDSRLSGVPTVEGPRDPTVNDHYPIQTVWRNSVTFRECMLVGFTSGEAIWSCFTDSHGTILDVNVDFNTAPGTDPVEPSDVGLITILGNAVVNGTNLNSPVATHSRALNQFHVDVQLGTTLAAAPGDPFDAGLASYAEADFGMDGNGHVTLDPILRNKAGYYTNLGVSYAGGTGVFTVRGATATLSATNPAYVTFGSQTTPGETVTIPIEADQNFIDDAGASEIIGNLFGYTTVVAVVAITVDVPFFIYAVLNDDEDAVSFMISREAGRNLSPTSGIIGTPSSAAASTQESFFAFDNITTTEWDQNPCVLVGAFRMQMSAVNDWTVTTLTAREGIGFFLEDFLFTQPLGQFGSAAGTITVANGGTLPAFTNNNGYYRVTRTGWVKYDTFLNLDDGQDGAGAFTALFTMPFKPSNTSIVNTIGLVRMNFAGGNPGTCFFNSTGDNNFCQVYLEGNSRTAVLWSAFANGTRTVNIDGYYNYLD